jgi:hypothetical protein
VAPTTISGDEFAEIPLERRVSLLYRHLVELGTEAQGRFDTLEDGQGTLRDRMTRLEARVAVIGMAGASIGGVLGALIGRSIGP